MSENGADTSITESAESKIEKIIKLPMTRIKALMKIDPDVTLAAQDAVTMIAKATEMFVSELSRESYTFTSLAKRKTVQKKDVDNAIENIDALAFLEGAIDA
ncbi:DNA polymerase epsilon subunit 4-like [Tubulanus polymorphus]|uniref:DNA polymerase epsilon subunit 4-like n=1 Tax=Tubulanus polymorphus TaxID=672921 RepID=UPI003DA653A2